MIITDVYCGNGCTIMGVIGKNIEDIKEKVAKKQGLNSYGKKLLKVIIRN